MCPVMLVWQAFQMFPDYFVWLCILDSDVVLLVKKLLPPFFLFFYFFITVYVLVIVFLSLIWWNLIWKFS